MYDLKKKDTFFNQTVLNRRSLETWERNVMLLSLNRRSEIWQFDAEHTDGHQRRSCRSCLFVSSRRHFDPILNWPPDCQTFPAVALARGTRLLRRGYTTARFGLCCSLQINEFVQKRRRSWETIRDGDEHLVNILVWSPLQYANIFKVSYSLDTCMYNSAFRWVIINNITLIIYA